MSQPKINFELPENLPEYFVSGIYGGLSPVGANLLCFVEDPLFESSSYDGKILVREIQRKAQMRIRMTPTTFKMVTQWMQSQLKQYEEKFGKITMPGNVQFEQKGAGAGADYQ
jgi:hypothetical protein